MSATAKTKLDGNNRVVLPRSAREQARIDPETEFAVIVEGEGDIRLLTRRAITERMQEMFLPLRESGYSVEQYLREKDEDAEAEQDEAG